MGWVIATLAAIVGVAAYAIACWIWPFADCKRCKGKGAFRSPSKKYRRTCRKCKGSGTRLRTGRRIWNALGVLRQEGS